MAQLLGANGLPLVMGAETIGPGRAAKVVITESTEITFPGAKTLRLVPGEYAIITTADLDAMTTLVPPAPGRVS